MFNVWLFVCFVLFLVLILWSNYTTLCKCFSCFHCNMWWSAMFFMKQSYTVAELNFHTGTTKFNLNLHFSGFCFCYRKSFCNSPNSELWIDDFDNSALLKGASTNIFTDMGGLNPGITEVISHLQTPVAIPQHFLAFLNNRKSADLKKIL